MVLYKVIYCGAWGDCSMAEQHVKFTERVAEHSEVFNSEREVKAMLKLVK